MRCQTCNHLRAVHFSQTGDAVPCRITGCGCTALVEPAAPAQADSPRRICIDLPDGYMVSVSLVPYSGDGESETANGAVTIEAVPEEAA
jgi:hypothetical protein